MVTHGMIYALSRSSLGSWALPIWPNIGVSNHVSTTVTLTIDQRSFKLQDAGFEVRLVRGHNLKL